MENTFFSKVKSNALSSSQQKHECYGDYWGHIFDTLVPIKIVNCNKSAKYYYYCDVPDKSLNQMTNMHGGAVYTLLNILSLKSLNDFSIISNNQSKFVLTEMTVKYLSAIKKDSKIIVEIFIEKHGKSVSFVNMAIFSAPEKVKFDQINLESNIDSISDFSLLTRASASYGVNLTSVAKF